jgi:hypothetical protein
MAIMAEEGQKEAQQGIEKLLFNGYTAPSAG